MSGSRARRSVWQSAQKRCGVGGISCGPSCSVWQSTQRPGLWPKKAPTLCWSRRKPPRFGRRPREPAEIGMVVDGGVAGLAGRVAHRDERLDVAGLAIVLERGMALRLRLPREPHLVGVDSPAPSRCRRRGSGRRRRSARRGRRRAPATTESPGHRPLARHHRGEREAADVDLLGGRIVLGRARPRSRRRRLRPAVGMTRSRNGPIRMSPPWCRFDLAEAASLRR